MLTKSLIDRVVTDVFMEYSLQKKVCTPDLCAGCGHCVFHKKEAVGNIINSGAERISSTLNIPEPIEFDLAKMIDHTLLKPEATTKDIIQLCEEAVKYSFASVCVNPCYVKLCYEKLKNTSVKVCTVIGFPLGANTTEIKRAEARKAINEGATELDMVINVGMLKSKEFDYVFNDIQQIVLEAKPKKVLTKVILETCLLTDEEKVQACLLAKEAGANFVKTSTGFNKGGATVGDIALMRKVVGSSLGVKASGGIRTKEDAESMILSGADRIGASASVKIVSAEKDQDASKNIHSKDY